MRELWTLYPKIECGRYLSISNVLIGKRKREIDGGADYSMRCLLHSPLNEASSSVNFKRRNRANQLGDVGWEVGKLSRVVWVNVPHDKKRRERAQ